MVIRFFGTLFHIILLIFLLGVFAQESVAFHSERYKVVDGIAIYLGIVPANIIRGYAHSHPERAMHGGVPSSARYHHVMIAVFDNKSGSRIRNAEVKARVGELGLSGPQKRLELMVIADTITYGNYFSMAAPGNYIIHIQIRLPGTARPIEAKFQYVHHLKE